MDTDELQELADRLDRSAERDQYIADLKQSHADMTAAFGGVMNRNDEYRDRIATLESALATERATVERATAWQREAVPMLKVIQGIGGVVSHSVLERLLAEAGNGHE